jgi:PAS domain S-box-containing protein
MATRVFVVEDEPVVASGIVKKLEHLGYEVLGTAASGESAVRSIERYMPDIVLMDIKLSGKLDGIEAAGLVHEQLNIPVVYLTSFSDEATMERALRAGPYGYLVKPFSERELAGALEVAMMRSKIHRRTEQSEQHYRMLSGAVSDYAYCLRLADEPSKDELLWSDGSVNQALGVDVPSFRTIADAMKYVHPDDVDAVRAFTASSRDTERLSLEFRVLVSRDEVRWIKADTRRFRNSARSPVVVYGSYQHVIRDSGAAAATDDPDAALGQVLHTINQGVWIGDADRVCTYINDALCRLTGYSHETLVGTASLQTLLGVEPSGDDSDAVFEEDLRCADGSTVASVVTTRAIMRDGEPTGYFYLFVDVSQQRRALELVELGRRKLQSVFHASADPSLLVDSATNAIVDVNEAFCVQTGYSADSLVGRGVFVLAEYENLEDLNSLLVLMQQDSGSSGLFRLRTESGDIRTLSVVIRHIEVEGETVLILSFADPDPDPVR